MRLILLACACFAVATAPAHACRALWEYPEVRSQLAVAQLPAAEKQAIEQRLDLGWELHARGENGVDPELVRQSLEILDQIKARLSTR